MASFITSATKGILSASGISPLFAAPVGDSFAVRFVFSNDASGNVTVKRSTDGTNFAPITGTGPVLSQRSSSGVLWFFEFETGGAYRIDAALTAGSVSWQAIQSPTQSDLVGLEIGRLTSKTSWYFGNVQYVGDKIVPPTAAQLLQAMTLKFTPIADTDLAGDLTVYKACLGNTFAKLVFPAAAQRCKGMAFGLGGLREIRAEYADVVSLVDYNGNAVASARSMIDVNTTYAPGARVTARDIYGTSTGVFTSSTNRTGIYAVPTLLEAVTGNTLAATPIPNLAKLGL